MSPAAYRRAVRQGNGWYGFNQDVAATAASLEGLAAARGQVERDAALGKLEISVTPSVPVDASVVRQYEDLGVDRLVLLPGRFSDAAASAADSVLGFIEATATALRL